MKMFFAVVLVALAVPVLAQQNTERPATASGAAKLTEEQELKKQVFLLKVENAQLKAQLADSKQKLTAMELVMRQQVEAQFAAESKDLSAQCKVFEDEFRVALKPPKEAKFNCATLEFEQ